MLIGASLRSREPNTNSYNERNVFQRVRLRSAWQREFQPINARFNHKISPLLSFEIRLVEPCRTCQALAILLTSFFLHKSSIKSFLQTDLFQPDVDYIKVAQNHMHSVKTFCHSDRQQSVMDSTGAKIHGEMNILFQHSAM